MINNFFKKKDTSNDIIFIVEDNEAYAKSLRILIKTHFPDLKEVKTFRIGELCLMELNRNPRIVIMDYFLNSKYEKAQNGLEIIKHIKAKKPDTNIIVLSAQGDFNVVLEAIRQYDCIYIQKDEDSYKKVELNIREILYGKNTLATKLGG